MTTIEPTTISIPLTELSLEGLVQLSQRLGREVDAIREQRAYLREKIEERMALGERSSTDPACVPSPLSSIPVEPIQISTEELAIIETIDPGI